jgi:hypothetical protein
LIAGNAGFEIGLAAAFCAPKRHVHSIEYQNEESCCGKPGNDADPIALSDFGGLEAH